MDVPTSLSLALGPQVHKSILKCAPAGPHAATGAGSKGWEGRSGSQGRAGGTGGELGQAEAAASLQHTNSLYVPHLEQHGAGANAAAGGTAAGGAAAGATGVGPPLAGLTRQQHARVFKRRYTARWVPTEVILEGGLLVSRSMCVAAGWRKGRGCGGALQGLGRSWSCWWCRMQCCPFVSCRFDDHMPDKQLRSVRAARWVRACPKKCLHLHALALHKKTRGPDRATSSAAGLNLETAGNTVVTDEGHDHRRPPRLPAVPPEGDRHGIPHGAARATTFARAQQGTLPRHALA